MSYSNTVQSEVDRELDLSNTGRGMWLVKVPKYIAQKWDNASEDIEVGKLKISRVHGQRDQVQLSLSEAILCLNKSGEQALPKEHRLVVSNVTRQSLGVFSNTVPSNTETVLCESEKLYMEGRILQKLECRPYADPTYYKLKSESIKKASMPQRQVQQLEGIVQNFKPVAVHKHDIDYQLKKKAEGVRTRGDKEAVLNALFAAFEKHQYYYMKDLQMITRQPKQYLNEILKEICNYNLKNPHKHMWELKHEYRHYKSETPVEAKEKRNPANSDRD